MSVDVVEIGNASFRGSQGTLHCPQRAITVGIRCSCVECVSIHAIAEDLSVNGSISVCVCMYVCGGWGVRGRPCTAKEFCAKLTSI